MTPAEAFNEQACHCCSNKPVLHRLVEPGQYVSIRYSERLAEAGITGSVGTVGDSYDCQSVSAGSRNDGVVLAGVF